ncbi:MAG: tail fiber protein [Chloroflexota bacterium]
MTTPFIGEIRMFAGTYAPVGWAICDGRIINVSDNDALFSLLGTKYGGNGRTTFGLPDLRGRLPMHFGQGPGRTNRPIGQQIGSETATIANVSQLPAHSHNIPASGVDANSQTPVGTVIAVSPNAVGGRPFFGTTGAKSLSGSALTYTGGGAAHTNIMPFTVLNFIIALVGIMPSQT